MKRTDIEQDAFLRRARERLEAGTDELDPLTLARLGAIRARALERAGEQRRGHGTRWWLPVGGLATAAVVALALLLVQQGPERGLPAAQPVDVELLSSSVDLELLDELEFYEWLVLENGNAG